MSQIHPSAALVDRTQAGLSLFDQAAQIFDGWPDPETGLAVLRITPPQDAGVSSPWHTLYHQYQCFLDGGRKVLLRTGTAYAGWGGTSHHLLDLTDGSVRDIAPPPYNVVEVRDDTWIALVTRETPEGTVAALWDIKTQRELVTQTQPGWRISGFNGLSDNRRALVGRFVGKPYDEPVHTQFHLLGADGSVELVLDEQDACCNHMQGCPTDPDLFSYDRWPCPRRPTDNIIHLRRLDEPFDQPLPMRPETVRPGPIWGGQRDHYVWTPDGQRIASYFAASASDSTDHFDYDWWISVLDWRTGEDLAVPYPPGRWGCHFRVTPDARYIVSGGGRSFQHLYATDIEGLRQGWNERILCTYPATQYGGTNREPFHHPVVLPDQSGVLFNAGWPGPEHDVYLVEWPQG